MAVLIKLTTVSGLQRVTRTTATVLTSQISFYLGTGHTWLYSSRFCGTSSSTASMSFHQENFAIVTLKLLFWYDYHSGIGL